MSEWTPTERQRPVRDQLVEWISPDGQQVRGRFCGGAIWFPEGGQVYVYYTPAFWRPSPVPAASP